jgi:hypothetical protein
MHGMDNTTTPTDTPSVRIDADMVLTVTSEGELVVVHRKLVEPLPIDLVQLRNWLRRQLRETV